MNQNCFHVREVTLRFDLCCFVHCFALLRFALICFIIVIIVMGVIVVISVISVIIIILIICVVCANACETHIFGKVGRVMIRKDQKTRMPEQIDGSHFSAKSLP